MLIEIYIEALLVDEELADQVWELWQAGLTSDELACIAWWIVTTSGAVGRTATDCVVAQIEDLKSPDFDACP